MALATASRPVTARIAVAPCDAATPERMEA